jgi:hypothetical protein
MATSISPLIETIARDYQLTVHVDTLHSAEGIELRKERGHTGTLICVGYYFFDREKTEIYRRIDNKRDVFVRTKLWFLWGWLIKPRISDPQYKVLRVVAPSEFSEQLFVDLAKQEFDGNREEG